MAEFGETVLVHYAGVLDDGRVLENSRKAGAPIQVRIGSGKLLPAVERMLCDMLPGDKRAFHLDPQQAFGNYDESLVQHVPASAIPNANQLPLGGHVELRTSAGSLRAKVVSADEREVVLDCNHELAGQGMTCELEMVAVVHESAIHRELHPAGCACGCDKLKQQIG